MSILYCNVSCNLFLSTLRGRLSIQYEAENVLQSAGASVVVRSVLFGNFHPLPSSWHAVRRPKLWQVEKSSFYNKVITSDSHNFPLAASQVIKNASCANFVVPC